MSWVIRPLVCPSLAGRSRSGFTVVEMAVTLSVLMIALYALTSTVWRLHGLADANQERRVAENALRSITEEVHSFSAAAQTDPQRWARTLSTAFAPGGRPGNQFDVRELSRRQGSASVGTVRIVTDETVSDEELGFDLGLPRDLDGDGLVSNPDVSGKATLLPVVVTLRWKGASGEREIVHGFFELPY